ncbi:MAG: hypothetical protein WAM60_06070, partial [Candidatus Promineifilaceae bacterium]
DISDIQLLGSPVPHEAMWRYAEAARHVRDSFSRQRANIDPTLKMAFKQAIAHAEDELIRLRLAGGAMHTVFGKTIEVLLRRQGALPTTGIHRRIQQLLR